MDAIRLLCQRAVAKRDNTIREARAEYSRIARLAIPPPFVVGRMPAQNAAAFGKGFGYWTQRGSSRAAGAEALKSTCCGMGPTVGIQKPEPWAKKWWKIHRALDTGGPLIKWRLLRPGSAPGQPKWEMSAKLMYYEAVCGAS
jgi:hypothetical protein